MANPMSESEKRIAIESAYSLGHTLFGEERYQEAALVFRVMLRSAPTDERAWLAVGMCHERIGQSDVALELYGAGTVAASPAPRCQLARGRVLATLDRVDDAHVALEAALELASDSDDPTLLRSVMAEIGRLS